MESPVNLINPLLEKGEAYCKTSMELLKLTSLEKTTSIASTFISRLLLAITLSLFVLMLTIAIALWIGELLGKHYYGFLVVASFYGFTGMVLFFMHPLIKARVSNSLIKHMLS